MQYVTNKDTSINRPIWIFSKTQYGNKIVDVASLVANLRGFYLCAIPNKEIITAFQDDVTGDPKLIPLPFYLRAVPPSLEYISSYELESIMLAPDCLYNPAVQPKGRYSFFLEKRDAAARLRSTRFFSSVYANGNNYTLEFGPGATLYSMQMKKTNYVRFSTLFANADKSTNTIESSRIGITYGACALDTRTDANGGFDFAFSTGTQLIASVRKPTVEEMLDDSKRAQPVPYQKAAQIGATSVSVTATFNIGDTSSLIAFQTDGKTLRQVDVDKHISVSKLNTIGYEEPILRRVKTVFDQGTKQVEI